MVTKSTAATGDQQVLARVLKEAMKSGKYTIGTKEVISEMKSSKMVIAASTISSENAAEGGLVKEAARNNVPVVRIDKSSAQLGKMIGRPFRVSAISLRVVAEGDFRQLVGSPSHTAKTTE
jgi:large subunit ribosomal protein L30e